MLGQSDVLRLILETLAHVVPSEVRPLLNFHVKRRAISFIGIHLTATFQIEVFEHSVSKSHSHVQIESYVQFD